jgi:hypothetical protein
VLSAADPSGWLRGQELAFEDRIDFTAVPRGVYRFALAIVDTTHAMSPAITLAVTEERTPAGWYPVAEVEVV